MSEKRQGVGSEVLVNPEKKYTTAQLELISRNERGLFVLVGSDRIDLDAGRQVVKLHDALRVERVEHGEGQVAIITHLRKHPTDSNAQLETCYILSSDDRSRLDVVTRDTTEETEYYDFLFSMYGDDMPTFREMAAQYKTKKLAEICAGVGAAQGTWRQADTLSSLLHDGLSASRA